jgi:hypothetical protein
MEIIHQAQYVVALIGISLMLCLIWLLSISVL